MRLEHPFTCPLCNAETRALFEVHGGPRMASFKCQACKAGGRIITGLGDPFDPDPGEAQRSIEVALQLLAGRAAPANDSGEPMGTESIVVGTDACIDDEKMSQSEVP